MERWSSSVLLLLLKFLAFVPDGSFVKPLAVCVTCAKILFVHGHKQTQSSGQGLGIAGRALINSGAPPKLEASLEFAGFASKYVRKLHQRGSGTRTYLAVPYPNYFSCTLTLLCSNFFHTHSCCALFFFVLTYSVPCCAIILLCAYPAAQ